MAPAGRFGCADSWAGVVGEKRMKSGGWASRHRLGENPRTVFNLCTVFFDFGFSTSELRTKKHLLQWVLKLDRNQRRMK